MFHELESYLGDFVDDYDMDGIMVEATEADANGNRYWVVDDDELVEICKRNDMLDRLDNLVKDGKAVARYQHDPDGDFGELFVKVSDERVRNWIEGTLGASEQEVLGSDSPMYVIPIGNGESYQERLWSIIKGLDE